MSRRKSPTEQLSTRRNKPRGSNRCNRHTRRKEEQIQSKNKDQAVFRLKGTNGQTGISTSPNTELVHAQTEHRSSASDETVTFMAETRKQISNDVTVSPGISAL